MASTVYETETCVGGLYKNLPIRPWSKVHNLSWSVRSLPLVRANLLARHSARASNVSMAGPHSMISRPGWLAFFDSELCSVRCGDEFGLEFNWKGALNPVLWFCGGIGAAGMLLVFFFRFERESVQNPVCSLYSFLGEETQKAITHLKGFRCAEK